MFFVERLEVYMRLTTQCKECEIPNPATYPPSWSLIEVALFARMSSSSENRIAVPESSSCQAWSISVDGFPRNFGVSGSPFSHLLTYVTGAGARFLSTYCYSHAKKSTSFVVLTVWDRHLRVWH